MTLFLGFSTDDFDDDDNIAHTERTGNTDMFSSIA